MSRLHTRSTQRLRASIAEWLFCWDGFRAAANVLGIVMLFIASRHAQPLVRTLEAGAAAFLAYRPAAYLVFPPLVLLMTGCLMLFLPSTQNAAEYPCPICGYDVRETLSRCPECGTGLQWGQLPDNPRQK